MTRVSSQARSDSDRVVAVSRRPLVRTRVSMAVVDFVLEEIFEGRLRSGERLHLDEIAEVLGVSRTPVREGLMILERDGIVSTTYHRGVFVAPFDADSIIDDFDILGMLSSVAVARLAERRDEAVIRRLQSLVEGLCVAAAESGERFGDAAAELLRTQHRAGGSRRLRIELRAFAGLFRVGTGRSREAVVRGHAAVVDAIVAGDADEAARLRIEDFHDAGRMAVQELKRRGVLDDEGRAVGPGPGR